MIDIEKIRDELDAVSDLIKMISHFMSEAKTIDDNQKQNVSFVLIHFIANTLDKIEKQLKEYQDE